MIMESPPDHSIRRDLPHRLLGLRIRCRRCDEQVIDAESVFAEPLGSGAEFLIDLDDSGATAELIDKVYGRTGLSPRLDDALAICEKRELVRACCTA